jgi:hypothetical protein
MEPRPLYCVHSGCTNPTKRIIKTPDERNSHFGSREHDKL